MASVEIEYCVPCGYLNRATDVSEALLSALGSDLDRVALVTGDHGVFRVTVDGEAVFDKETNDYDVDDVVRRVREAL